MPLWDTDENRKYQREWSRNAYENATAFTGNNLGKCAFAGEALVQIDLSLRGFEVTVPVSHTAKHDLHVELPSVGWVGVQVKVCPLYKKTGRLKHRKRGKQCKSPVLAFVHPSTGRIEYHPGTEPLPKELKYE